MRTRTLTLTVAALATFTALGTVVATARTAPTIDHAAVIMGVGNPHGAAFTAASAEPTVDHEQLKQWENVYSRDVWPGMGVANVHTR